MPNFCGYRTVVPVATWIPVSEPLRVQVVPASSERLSMCSTDLGFPPQPARQFG